MRESELKKIAPIIERQISLPEDRAKDLKRRVRATAYANDCALGFYQKLMEDALIDQEEAWDECTKLMGFKGLDDMHEQGYVMSLNGNQLQLRKKEEAVDA